MESEYAPPFVITPDIVHLVSEISETLGAFSATAEGIMVPMLRRGNRIRSIQASLAIENNTLSLDQVIAIANGKRVLGHPREIQEVKNAFSAYDMLESLSPFSEEDLLRAHKALMTALSDEAGQYRSGGVGIVKGDKFVHVAPPAGRIPILMRDLFNWLGTTTAHPLIASSVFHYEFEFIHPFSDGNGRMGRLWQTLILRNWRPILAYLPVETVIRTRQDDYNHSLRRSDKMGNSTVFIEFMLNAVLDSLREAISSDQVGDQVSDQVKKLLRIFSGDSIAGSELMRILNLSHKPTFRMNYLRPAISQGFIEMTIPDRPNSRMQKYRLTHKGRTFIGK